MLGRQSEAEFEETIAKARDATTRAVRTVVNATIDAERGINTGGAMSPYAERGADLYETAPGAVRALLGVLELSGPIWECACGPGAIVRELRTFGHHVIATDLNAYGCENALGGVDFLAQTSAPGGAQTILTNPLFMHADAFVRHALTLAPRVVMLLRLCFLESERRSDILDGGMLARVLVFKNRLPLMQGPGPFPSSAIAMAWFVWDSSHHGPVELQRIATAPISEHEADDDNPDDAVDDIAIPDFLRRRVS